jgi:putative ABC transport system substrate-binding protein
LENSHFQGAPFHLVRLGWRVGGNLQIDYRWTGGNAARLRQYAAELVALAPDVILAAGGSHVGPLQQLTRTHPISLWARHRHSTAARK